MAPPAPAPAAPAHEAGPGRGSGPGTARVIAAASIGNALEFYDFIVYGFFAGPIGHAFFPSADAAASEIASFGAFGASFLARPVGAAVLGAYADRRGRRAAMTLAVILMTIGTAALAIVPGAATIGIAAPLLVLAARLIQGFSLGGEYGASTAFLIEHRPERAVFFASFQPISQYISSAAGAGVGFALGELMPHAAFESWGFRIAFGLGTLIGPIGLLLRRQLGETLTAPDSHAPVLELILRRKLQLAIGAGSIAIGTGITYIGVYLPTYAKDVLHLQLTRGLAATAIASLAAAPITLASALLVQRARRLRWMAISTALVMIAVWPLFAFFDAWPGIGTLVLLRVALIAIAGPYYALQPSMLASLFPQSQRVTGIAIGYTSGIVLFGAFAPALNAWLEHVTANPRAPALFLIGTGAVTLAALAGAASLEARRPATDGTPARSPARRPG